MSARDISFATFNLYNLQLPGKPWRWNADPYTEDLYRQKVAWSAEMVAKLDVDVIGFQELWSRQCLVDIFEKAGLQEQYQLVFIKDDWYDIAVAAAVRQPWQVRQTVIHKNFPPAFKLLKRGNDPQTGSQDDDIEVNVTMFSRSVMQLLVGHEHEADLPAIAVFATHLKSKLPTQLDQQERDDDAIRPHSKALGSALSTIRRTAEAAALRIILGAQMKHNNAPVVVLGDLNDGQLSNTLAIVTDQPNYRLSQASRRGSRSDTGLYATSTLQQLRSMRDVYYTHIYEGVREILDHVLVSEQFYDYSRQRIWSMRELRIWNDHVDDEDKSTSDHGVVAAYFDYDPA